MPTPPPGYGWILSASGWACVPLTSIAGAPAAPAPALHQPTGVVPYASMAPPPGAPATAHRSVKMLRSDGKDSYRDFLAGQPELSPAQVPGLHLGLVPDEAEIRDLPEMAPAYAVSANTQAHDDPSRDAFGGRAPTSRPIAPLVVISGGAGAGDGGDDPPAAA